MRTKKGEFSSKSSRTSLPPSYFSSPLLLALRQTGLTSSVASETSSGRVVSSLGSSECGFASWQVSFRSCFEQQVPEMKSRATGEVFFSNFNDLFLPKNNKTVWILLYVGYIVTFMISYQRLVLRFTFNITSRLYSTLFIVLLLTSSLFILTHNEVYILFSS